MAALTEAKLVVKLKSDYRAIHSTALLKWHFVKKTCAPCFICPNVQEALAGHDNVGLTARNNTIVRFFGCHYSHRDKIQAVPASQLKDYCGEEGDKERWSKDSMKTFLDSIRNQKEFKGDESDLKLRTEELVVQLVLTTVLAHERHQVVAFSESTQNENDDVDDFAPLVSTVNSPVRNRNCEISAADTAAAVATRVANNVHQVKRLRAGDVIEFWYAHCCIRPRVIMLFDPCLQLIRT